MSTQNIIEIQPVGGAIPTGVNVVFQVHGAEGSREYFYDGTEAALAILGGDDPANWHGVRGGAPSGDVGDIGSVIEGAVDVDEIADIGLLGLL